MPQMELLPIEFASAVERLLNDQHLQAQFVVAPWEVAHLLNVAESDVKTFVTLDPRHLNRQSKSLLCKRWHEIKRLLPTAIADLGDEGHNAFLNYAMNDWPQGHRRHPVDAFRFLNFLQSNRIVEPCKTELKRMRRLAS